MDPDQSEPVMVMALPALARDWFRRPGCYWSRSDQVTLVCPIRVKERAFIPVEEVITPPPTILLDVNNGAYWPRSYRQLLS